MTPKHPCRFHKICPYYSPNAFVCERDSEAIGYCGKFKELYRQGIDLK